MKTEEAKQVLAGYRPGMADADYPQVSAALRQAQRDPALQQWLDQHLAYQAKVRESFRAVPVPAGLADQILADTKIVPMPAWWKRREVWAAAACFIVLGCLASFWFKPSRSDSFAIFRARMVRAALREYRMDIVTNDMAQIQAFLRSNQSPADYDLSPELAKLSPIGGGILSWQGQHVSMVCLDSGKHSTLFLFVVDRASVKQPPSAPDFEQVNKLKTASWSKGDKSYLLAASDDSTLLQEYVRY